MTVTYDTPALVAPGTWRLTWSSDEASPTYRVYVDGDLAAAIDVAEYVLRVGAGEYPVVEVLDTDVATPAEAHPPRLDLWWMGVSAADYYRVDEYVDASWTERARIEENGSGAYCWRSRVLEDETVHQFRIVAVAADGNEATSVERSALMVRYPDPPDVAFAYASGTGKVTISSA